MADNPGERDDTRKMFKDMYSKRFGDDAAFADYLDFIVSDCESWYKDAPATYKSETSVSRLKSMINNLLNEVKYPAVASSVPVEKRATVRVAMRESLKTLVVSGYFKPRRGRRGVEVADVSVEGSSSSCGDVADLPEELLCDGGANDLRVENIRLKKLLSETKEIIIQLVEAADINNSWKPFIRMLIDKAV
jgi:hypothetical protein